MNRGFTLIELLIVIAILALLSAMLTSVMGIAQRKALETNTRALLMKVDQALRQFRSEIGTYPWNTDLTNAHADPTQWSNDLGRRLAWKPADAAERATYLTDMQSDLTTIGNAFAFINGRNVGVAGLDGTHAFRAEFTGVAGYRSNILLNENNGNVPLISRPNSHFLLNGGAASHLPSINPPANSDGGTAILSASTLTRLASEITLLRYLSGQLPTLAPEGLDPALPADKALRPKLDARYTTLCYNTFSRYEYRPYNKRGALGDDSRGPALGAAAAKASGWRGEYLSETLRRRSATSAKGDIDASGQTILDPYGHALVYVCTVSPGARAFSTSNLTILDELDYGMGPKGRAVTGAIASDVRSTAARPYALEFELWSPGRNGLFSAMRSDPQNADNISVLSYNKGLQ